MAPGASGGRRHSLSRLLVIGEMALAVLLLAGAGAMVRSFVNLSTADLGIRTGDVTAMLLNLPKERYVDARAQTAFFDRLRERLIEAPGVDSIAFTNQLPASGEVADPV